MLLAPVVPDVVRVLAELLTRLTENRYTIALGDIWHKRHALVRKRVKNTDLTNVFPVTIRVANDLLSGVCFLQPIDLAGVDHAEIPPCALHVWDPRPFELDGTLILDVRAPDLPADTHFRVMDEWMGFRCAGSEGTQNFFRCFVGAFTWRMHDVAHHGEGAGVDHDGLTETVLVWDLAGASRAGAGRTALARLTTLHGGVVLGPSTNVLGVLQARNSRCRRG